MELTPNEKLHPKICEAVYSGDVIDINYYRELGASYGCDLHSDEGLRQLECFLGGEDTDPMTVYAEAAPKKKAKKKAKKKDG